MPVIDFTKNDTPGFSARRKAPKTWHICTGGSCQDLCAFLLYIIVAKLYPCSDSQTFVKIVSRESKIASCFISKTQFPSTFIEFKSFIVKSLTNRVIYFKLANLSLMTVDTAKFGYHPSPNMIYARIYELLLSGISCQLTGNISSV